MRVKFLSIILFATASACCIFLCVSCGNRSSSNSGANSGQRTADQLAGYVGNTPTVSTQPQPEFPAPDQVLIIVRDLSGYLKDCGCSGGSGGLARLPSIAVGARQMNILLVGRTIFPRFQSDQGSAVALMQLRGNATVAATLRVWKAMGEVRWLQDEKELADFALLKIDISALLQWVVANPVDTGPLKITLTDETAEMDGVKIPLPPVDSRGREVLLLAFWGNADKSTQSWKLQRTVGPLLALPKKGPQVLAELNRLLKASNFPLWTYWSAKVASTVPENPAVLAIVNEAELAVAHNGTASALLRSNFSLDQVESEWSACAGCHEKAFAAWKDSKHFHAYKTLNDRAHATDGRCIACHVQKYSLEKQNLVIRPRHMAVTCMSCHESGRPSEACVRCHTPATDPEKRYLRRIKDICPGGLPNNATKCSRE